MFFRSGLNIYIYKFNNEVLSTVGVQSIPNMLKHLFVVDWLRAYWRLPRHSFTLGLRLA